MKYIAGDTYGGVQRNMLAYDQARDSRFFNSVAANQREQAALQAALQQNASMAQSQANADRSFGDSFFARQAALQMQREAQKNQADLNKQRFEYTKVQGDLARANSADRQRYLDEMLKLNKEQLDWKKTQPTASQISQMTKQEQDLREDAHMYEASRKLAELSNLESQLGKTLEVVGGSIGDRKTEGLLQSQYEALRDQLDAGGFLPGTGMWKGDAEKAAADKILAPYRKQYQNDLPPDVASMPFKDQLRQIQKVVQNEYDQVVRLSMGVEKSTKAQAFLTRDPVTGLTVSTYRRRYAGPEEEPLGYQAPPAPAAGGYVPGPPMAPPAAAPVPAPAPPPPSAAVPPPGAPPIFSKATPFGTFMIPSFTIPMPGGQGGLHVGPSGVPPAAPAPPAPAPLQVAQAPGFAPGPVRRTGLGSQGAPVQGITNTEGRGRAAVAAARHARDNQPAPIESFVPTPEGQAWEDRKKYAPVDDMTRGRVKNLKLRLYDGEKRRKAMGLTKADVINQAKEFVVKHAVEPRAEQWAIDYALDLGVDLRK